MPECQCFAAWGLGVSVNLPSAEEQDANVAAEGKAAEGPLYGHPANEAWAADFVHGQIATGRNVRVLTSSTRSRAVRPRSIRASAIAPRMWSGRQKRPARNCVLPVPPNPGSAQRSSLHRSAERSAIGIMPDNAIAEAFNARHQAVNCSRPSRNY